MVSTAGTVSRRRPASRPGAELAGVAQEETRRLDPIAAGTLRQVIPLHIAAAADLPARPADATTVNAGAGRFPETLPAAFVLLPAGPAADRADAGQLRGGGPARRRLFSLHNPETSPDRMREPAARRPGRHCQSYKYPAGKAFSGTGFYFPANQLLTTGKRPLTMLIVDQFLYADPSGLRRPQEPEGQAALRGRFRFIRCLYRPRIAAPAG